MSWEQKQHAKNAKGVVLMLSFLLKKYAPLKPKLT